MLTFSKNELILRLDNATKELLILGVKEPNKDESTRLLDKRAAVEACLAWWFTSTIDKDDDQSYLLLVDFSEWATAHLQLATSAGQVEGYQLVLSYIEEY